MIGVTSSRVTMEVMLKGDKVEARCWVWKDGADRIGMGSREFLLWVDGRRQARTAEL